MNLKERPVTDPKNPFVIVMWKLKGAEWLIQKQNNFSVPIDDTPTMFDLTAGRPVKEGGDVIVKFTRTPQQVTRGDKFDWRATIEAVDGGGYWR